MVRIAIIDDEQMWVEKAREFVEDFYEDREIKIDEYESGKSFIEADIEYDIVFVDIEMPEKDGFETATEYKAKYQEVIIIILTTHTEMSRKGYLVNAFRYIDKLEMENEIKEALTSSEYLFLQRETISLRLVGVGTIKIILKDLVYIETYKRNLVFHTKDNEYVCNSYTLEQMEKELEGKGFFRCHNSYIVNLDCIRQIEKGKVCTYSGERIFVSHRKLSELKSRYCDRKFKTANG